MYLDWRLRYPHYASIIKTEQDAGFGKLVSAKSEDAHVSACKFIMECDDDFYDATL